MKKVFCIVCAAMLLLSMVVPASAARFYNDVKEIAWYADAVDYVSENGLMQGTGSYLFSPEEVTTRGMIVTVMWRMAESPLMGYSAFPDIGLEYYSDAACWCYKNEIVKGYPINLGSNIDTGYGAFFRGENPVTREELACFLYRYAKYAGADVSQSASLEGFADAASVSDWAEVALGWCVAEGIIQGTPEGESLNLAPADHATRAEVAAMLMRYCQMIGQ